MGISITKNTLARFQRKVNNLADIADGLAERLVQEAMEIARSHYGSASELQDLRTEKVENGVYRLIAVGEQLAYIEFGTGLAGEGSGYPEDKKPTMVLKFKSHGKEQETSGWEYNYYKRQHEGKEGYENIKDWQGIKAGMQMYNTAQDLGRAIGRLAKEYAESRRKG